MKTQSKRVYFKAGDIIELRERLAFTPPGRYVFDSLSGNLAFFHVGDVTLAINADFLHHFWKLDGNIIEFDEEREHKLFVVRYAALLKSLEQFPAEEFEGVTIRELGPEETFLERLLCDECSASGVKIV